ncbi:MAG: CYTH domain-containing protein, partial [Planctomycetota bacterium]
MAQEIEAKFRVSSHDPVRARLQACGAKPLGCVLERNRIYDRQDGSLRAAGCGLRLRTISQEDGTSGQGTLTFKGPVGPGPFKSREEIETGITDPAALEAILDRLGLLPILVYDKRRESWAWNGCRIELDEVPRLGRFVEIEGPDEKTIAAVRDRLGLGRADHE